MKMRMIVALGVLAVSAVVLQADTLTDDFATGLNTARWQTFQNDASGAPWAIQAPDANGMLRISKAADSDASTNNLELDAGVKSRFALDGDFTASVDFRLYGFPNGYPACNEALIRLTSQTSGFMFETLRYNDRAEGFSNISPYVIGNVLDSTTIGRLAVSRSGATLSAWSDRGSGPVLLGSLTSPQLLGPMDVELFLAQTINPGTGRTHSAIDVGFDNFTATATTITPEPATLMLLALGGLGLMKRRRERHV